MIEAHGPKASIEENVDRLDELEAQAIYTLREAVNRLAPPAMLWSMAKDSSTLLSLARKACFGSAPAAAYGCGE